MVSARSNCRKVGAGRLEKFSPKKLLEFEKNGGLEVPTSGFLYS